MTGFRKTFQMFMHSPVGIVLSRVGAVMILFTVSRLIFYLLNIKLFPGIDAFSLLIIFLAGLRFDLTAVIYFNMAYFLLMLFPHKLHSRKAFMKFSNILFYTTNGIAFFMNSADIVYYRFTNRRTTFSVFEEFSNEKNFGPLLLHFLIDYYYVLIICGILIFLLYRLTKNQRINESSLNGWRYYFYNTVLLAAITPVIIIGARGGLPPKQDFPLCPSDAGQYVEHPNDVALVLNTPFTVVMTTDKKALPRLDFFVSEAELDSIYSPIHYPDSLRIKRRLNVVIIMVESLGRETVGFLNQKLENGKYKGYTPFLDSLCKHSYVFVNSFANSRISIEGSPAIAASIPSFNDSYTLSLYSGNRIMSLASCLKQIGYNTSYFHGAPNGSLGLNSFSKIAGFDRYYGKNEYNNNDDYDGTWGIWDHKFLPYVANSIGKNDSSFLAYIFTASSHHPFKIPSSLKDKFQEDPEKMHRSISYTDYSLKLFFDAASKKPWFNKTIFVITGDHTYTSMHHVEYMNPLGYLTVPIIFYEPGSSLTGVDSTLAEHIDIMPTILNYISYSKPYFAFGQDLFKFNPDKFVISYIGNFYQMLHGNYVLLFNPQKTLGVYNINIDRDLQNNLVGKADSIQNYLEKYAKAFIQQYFNRMADNKMTIGQ